MIGPVRTVVSCVALVCAGACSSSTPAQDPAAELRHALHTPAEILLAQGGGSAEHSVRGVGSGNYTVACLGRGPVTFIFDTATERDAAQIAVHCSDGVAAGFAIGKAPHRIAVSVRVSAAPQTRWILLTARS